MELQEQVEELCAQLHRQAHLVSVGGPLGGVNLLESTSQRFLQYATNTVLVLAESRVWPTWNVAPEDIPSAPSSDEYTTWQKLLAFAPPGQEPQTPHLVVIQNVDKFEKGQIWTLLWALAKARQKALPLIPVLTGKSFLGANLYGIYPDISMMIEKTTKLEQPRALA